mmetsp:Transcript_37055/g.59717  ORF Transcript_37055/g.59717 Transcript_37055/m.59717 type:complete len:80 (-) Transcript_37055:138-377(-)
MVVEIEIRIENAQTSFFFSNEPFKKRSVIRIPICILMTISGLIVSGTGCIGVLQQVAGVEVVVSFGQFAYMHTHIHREI